MIMNTLPQSSKAVLEILGTSGAMTHKDLVSKCHYSPRTIRYALKQLKERKLLIEKMNIHDMRQIIYQHRMVPIQETGKVDMLTPSPRTNRDFWRVQAPVPREQYQLQKTWITNCIAGNTRTKNKKMDV
jgi:hypothetical protein